MNGCSIPGCESPDILARGWCARHYHSWHRHGDPLAALPRGRSIEERLWRRCEVAAPDECWEWTGSRAHYGHGSMKGDGGTSLLAHRVAWVVTYGEVPAGLCVLHRCDNPPCCNPAHLFLGTQQDNIADMHAKGRYRKAGTRKQVAA